ncbi:hypothetical protein Ssi02_20270 [Sinosporangium siamense]|uniref:HTH cro/C1-type domain-containing protein n=1 Tax=Sinosporangium siamense TaxID=1367973 RepID=A0A919RH03_9ACTN|nr:hypothetical protein Ssi02_20270 [Sinosporangium siamense]
MTKVRAHWRNAPATAKGGAAGVVLAAAVAVWIGFSLADDPPTPSSPDGVTTASTTSAQPSTPATQLAHALRSGRTRLGISTREAARRSGLSRARVSEIERGVESPTAPELDTLSRVYELTMDEWATLVTMRQEIS